MEANSSSVHYNQCSSFLSDETQQKMNVPYNLSGASSSYHYSLVRRVENAKSTQETEELLLDARDHVRKRGKERMLSPVRSFRACPPVTLLILMGIVRIEKGFDCITVLPEYVHWIRDFRVAPFCVTVGLASG